MIARLRGNGLRRGLHRFGVWLRFVVRGRRVAHFLAYTGWRFDSDDGLRLAAGLSYSSLLALVPLLAIALAMLAAFPAFAEVREQLLTLVLENILPDTGEAAARMRSFVQKASALTGPGIIGLAVTAVLLLSNINGAFNQIWRVTEPRPLATRVLVYWALLTLGPLLVGTSLSLSGLVFTAVELIGLDSEGGWLPLSRLLSFLLAALGFGLVFFVVPNRRIAAGHAAVGGVVAALLFEALTYGFGLYLRMFPSYQAVYGAVASVPIFLLWLYLSWTVVLLGAEVTAALPEWRATLGRDQALASSTGAKLALALALLVRLRNAQREGRHLRRVELVRGLPATPAEMDAVLKPLREGRFIVRSQQGQFLLGRDLTTTSLGTLIDTLGYSLEPGPGWPPAAAQAVSGLAAAIAGPRERSLEEVLSDAERLARAA